MYETQWFNLTSYSWCEGNYVNTKQEVTLYSVNTD